MTFHELLQFKLFEFNDYSLTLASILVSLLIIIFTKVLLIFIHKVFKNQYKTKKLEPGKSNSIYKIIKYLLWLIAFGLVLQANGINVTLLIAGSAALLVGLGFGLQHFFNDLLSGIILLFEGTIKVDDIVEMENNIIGKVMEINLRTSKLVTRDNIIMIIPNSKLVNDRVINWSHMENMARFHIQVGVAYGSDVELVKTILLACAKSHNEIVESPGSFVRFLDFGDSSLEFQLYFWSDRMFEIENIKSDLRYSIDEEFRKNKVHIPFPQRDIHIRTQ